MGLRGGHFTDVVDVDVVDDVDEIHDFDDIDNVVDDVEHVMKANTSPHLLEQAVGHRRFVTGTLAELMTGRCTVDRSKPAIFSPFGLGVLDLAVGKWIYDEAVAAGQDLRLTDFFYDMTR